MALTFPVPNDATYDYVPIAGPDVQVGTSLLSMWTVQGTVSTVISPDPDWGFLMATINPDGSLSVGVAQFPADPGSMPTDWWARQAIWKRAAKLADGAALTAGDGSQWRYPAGEDGRMVCTHAGTTYAQGARKFRGELTTNPDDHWICDDADWDWLPITDGSDVTVGDTITFLSTVTGVVDQIQATDTLNYTVTGFTDASDVQLGWWYANHQVVAGTSLQNVWTFFQRLAKPSAGASFRGVDGSRWDYVGSGLYYCWGLGTAYSTGALFHRGEIAGGLTSIT